MLTRLLRATRRYLQRATSLRSLLVSLGLVDVGKSIYHRLLLQRQEMTTTLMGQRLRFSVSTKREIRRIDALHGERDLLRVMLDNIQTGDVVYDIGANIGVLSLILAKARDVTVHAFEPEPRNFAHLERNIRLNALDEHIVPHMIALGSRPEQAVLYVKGEAGTGTHSLIPSSDATDESVEVPVQTVKAVAEELAALPDVVKIDVEGVEFSVLVGMAPIMNQQKPRDLFIELHPRHLKAQQLSTQSLEEWLLGRGYKLVWSAMRGSEEEHHYYRHTDC